MQAPAIPNNEIERIATLRTLLILDTPPEARFDNLVKVAASYFRVPIALASLVDENRQWFKAACGLDAKETPRDISFCGHAILGEGPFIISNALEDTRFADNPLVLGAPFIRFYAGVPLKASNGHKLGTLCIISPEPKQMTPDEINMLVDMGKLVEVELQKPPFDAPQSR